MKFFLDISNNQGGNVDPAEIQADAVYLKASEGGGFTDGWRPKWQPALEARGIPCGTYHFHRASTTPKYQLQRWIDSGLDGGQLRPVLDCEDNARTLSGNALSRSCLDLAELVANHCGIQPIIYTGKWWLDSYADHDPAWATYDLWLAGYPMGYSRAPGDDEATNWFEANKYCYPPPPWSGSPLAWQFTSIAQVPGVNGNCDRSIITDSNFTKLFRTNTTPVEQPKDDEMPLLLLQAQGDPAVWVTDLVTRRHVGNEARLADLNTLNGENGGKMINTTVRVVSPDFLADIPVVLEGGSQVVAANIDLDRLINQLTAALPHAFIVELQKSLPTS